MLVVAKLYRLLLALAKQLPATPWLPAYKSVRRGGVKLMLSTANTPYITKTIDDFAKFAEPLGIRLSTLERAYIVAATCPNLPTAHSHPTCKRKQDGRTTYSVQMYLAGVPAKPPSIAVRCKNYPIPACARKL